MDYFQRYIEEGKKRKGKENTCSRYPPFFLRKFLSPLSKHLGYAAIYTSKPLSRARGKGEERRKKGGERKREFSRPSFAFYPPRSGSKSREPLSHRLLDACKYPWQRGTTMRGDPRRELFLRISGWSALPKISRRKRERGGSLWEKFPFDPRPIPSIAALFLNSFPLSWGFISARKELLRDNIEAS